MAISIDTCVEKLPPPIKVPNVALPALSTEQTSRLSSIFGGVDKLSFDDKNRCRHGTGHSQSDIFKLRSNIMGRVPDVVVYPDNENQVRDLVQVAKETRLCLKTCVCDCVYEMCDTNNKKYEGMEKKR